MFVRSSLVAAVALLALSTPALADPCGMVPPVYVGDDVPIARIGIQKTYVFHAAGIETIVLRPGFTGKVEEFGMLIPFPDVPAIRKVSDNVFPHIAAAIDPPEVVVDVRPPVPFAGGFGGGGLGGGLGGFGGAMNAPLALKKDEVKVVSEEAVGMYEVAVIRAGSADALKEWMEDHDYRFPDGMEEACEEYVEDRWCFVAVRTRVGAKAGVDPKPGMRKVDDKLPKGSSFDGHVQAMGFRFRTKRPVIPMRLSTFNEGELRNVVYILAEGPAGLRSIPREYVVRQVPGEILLRNVTQPLPLRIIGGTVRDLKKHHEVGLAERRDPVPHNGVARDLFAGDLQAATRRRLALPHEETEKMLLRIGERLELRGPDIDAMHADVLERQRETIVRRSIERLRGMTLSVVDGDFPRAVLAEQNLQLASYRMLRRRNSPKHYDANRFGPAEKPEGRQRSTLYYGKISALGSERDSASPAHADSVSTRSSTPWTYGGLAALGVVGAASFWVRRRSD